jgi:hypothetical protein
MAVLWDAATCSLVDTNQRFKRTYCLHNQCDSELKFDFSVFIYLFVVHLTTHFQKFRLHGVE